MLELKGVSRRFGGVVALWPTDLVVERGRTTVLLGPSGSGKSTLLRLMLGLLRPDAGEVRFDGQPLPAGGAGAHEAALALRRRMGYVVQEGGLFPHLSARANVELVARHLGWERSRIEARVGELAGLARLPVELLDRYPGEISGGQRQRVGLMRALMLDPQVLFLDEPLGALDPLVRHELQVDLRQVFARLQKTVVVVTHDLAEAAFFAHTLVLLREGRIVQRGSFADLWHRPAEPFVTRFVQAQQGLREPPSEGGPP